MGKENTGRVGQTKYNRQQKAGKVKLRSGRQRCVAFVEPEEGKLFT